MKKRINRQISRNNRGGFTLIELLVVVAIIGLLANLGYPAMQKALTRAKSIKCANNLRNIGIAVNVAAQDNNNTYPKIEPDPSNPVYSPDDGAKSLADALAPYGITPDVLRCPSDSKNEWKTRGSSYQWRPQLDDESTNQPYVYRRGEQIPVSSTRVRILMDFDPVHSGRNNLLYGDGRVRSF